MEVVAFIDGTTRACGSPIQSIAGADVLVDDRIVVDLGVGADVSEARDSGRPDRVDPRRGESARCGDQPLAE